MEVVERAEEPVASGAAAELLAGNPQIDPSIENDHGAQKTRLNGHLFFSQ
jgi:hypothetical protein